MRDAPLSSPLFLPSLPLSLLCSPWRAASLSPSSQKYQRASVRNTRCFGYQHVSLFLARHIARFVPHQHLAWSLNSLSEKIKQEGLSVQSVAEGHLCFGAIKGLTLFWQLASFHLFPSVASGSRQMHRWGEKKLFYLLEFYLSKLKLKKNIVAFLASRLPFNIPAIVLFPLFSFVSISFLIQLFFVFGHVCLFICFGILFCYCLSFYLLHNVCV